MKQQTLPLEPTLSRWFDPTVNPDPPMVGWWDTTDRAGLSYLDPVGPINRRWWGGVTFGWSRPCGPKDDPTIVRKLMDPEGPRSYWYRGLAQPMAPDQYDYPLGISLVPEKVRPVRLGARIYQDRMNRTGGFAPAPIPRVRVLPDRVQVRKE